MDTYEINAASKEPCHDWPLGKCPHGNECRREHHQNLDPMQPKAETDLEYMVPN